MCQDCCSSWRGGKAAEVPVDAACNNLCRFEAWAERRKCGRGNGLLFRSYQFSCTMHTNVTTWTSKGENLIVLRSAKHPVSLIRHVVFKSCLSTISRGQEHLEKIDENLRYKFKSIRLEGLAALQNLPCHLKHSDKSHFNSPQTIKAEKSYSISEG